MDAIAFVNSAADLPALKELPPKATIIYLDNSPANSKSDGWLHLPRKKFVDDDSLYNAYKKAMEWLKRWSCMPLRDGKSFKEIFIYKDFSIWWFIDFWLFYHEIHRMTIQDIALNLHIIDTVVRKEKPAVVHILDEGSSFSDLAILYCQSNRIAFVKKRCTRSIVQRSRPYILEFLKYQKYTFRSMVSRLLCRKLPRKADILLVGLTAQLREEQDAQERMSDQMLKPIIALLREKGISYVYTDRDFTRTLGVRTMGRTGGIPSEYFMDRKIFLEAHVFQQKLFREYLQIRENIASSFVYDGIPIWPLVERRFDFIFRHKVTEAALWIGAFTAMIDAFDPHSILIIDETGISGRAATIAGRMCNKRVVGIQHGAISPLSFEYMHLDGEVSNTLDIHAPFCPVPHKTAVYGRHTRDLLVNDGNYPEKCVAITGQPRYDIITQLKDTLDKKKVCDELGVDPEKKIILILTQPGKDRQFFAQAIFNAIKDYGECQILLKLHPRDSNQRGYRELAKKEDLEIKVYSQDLFRLLFIADIVIQRDSTVGIEAMLFGKPLICAYLFCLDIARTNQYLESGCRIAWTPQELKRHIREALDGTQNKKYLDAQNAWVQKETLNHDGHATQRVVDLITPRNL